MCIVNFSIAVYCIVFIFNFIIPFILFIQCGHFNFKTQQESQQRRLKGDTEVSKRSAMLLELVKGIIGK